MIDQASKLRSLVAGDEAPESVGTMSPESAAILSPESAAILSAESSAILSAVEGRIPREVANTRVFAVTSGKGGVGKTTVAVNLALLLAEAGKRALIMDADLGLANVDVMLGIESPRHVGHLLLDSMTPDEIASTGPFGLRAISGGSGLRELAQATHKDRAQILEKLKTYCREYEYVIIDTSPGIGGEVMDFLRGSDEILLVTTTEPTSLRDTYAALKSIVRELPEHEVRLVVTSASYRQASDAVTALNNVSGKFLERAIDRWQHVETDDLVGRSVRDRIPLVCNYPRSAAATCLRHLAKTLTETRVGP